MRSETETPTVAPGPAPARSRSRRAAAATAAVVVSAALEPGRGHWAAALVALPLLVAAVVIARIAYPRLLVATGTARSSCMLAAIATGGLVALWRRRSVGRRRCTPPPRPPRSQRRSSRSSSRSAASRVAFGPWQRLRHPDEAADHVPAAPDRCGRDVRRRRGLAGSLAVRRDDARARARLRRLERAQPRAGRGHRPADGRTHGRPPGRRGSGRGAARARVRRRADGALVRAARDDGERADRRRWPSSAGSSTSSSTPAT